tara:strand:+ start:8474 stop:9487 length:1014 start_codon:yes stop_codon:yes gene_type:complete
MAKVIVTIGPSTNREEDLREIKKIGVDFVRANMSHTSLQDLKKIVELAKKVDIPFLLDTEGPQVRTGRLSSGVVALRGSDTIELHSEQIEGDNKRISLRPKALIKNLSIGDQLHFDGSLILRIIDIDTKNKGYITAVIVQPGRVGENKGVAIDSIHGSQYNNLPALSEKDLECIKYGLSCGIDTIAASFMRNGTDVLSVRDATEGKMKIISKVECQNALDNLDDILENSDGIIIDRHDLCKEIPKEKIFYTQKKIFDRANQKGKEAFASSYMLESMTDNKEPQAHECHNVIATLEHGADGLVLSAETTVGAHPHLAIKTLKDLIQKAEKTVQPSTHN